MTILDKTSFDFKINLIADISILLLFLGLDFIKGFSPMIFLFYLIFLLLLIKYKSSLWQFIKESFWNLFFEKDLFK